MKPFARLAKINDLCTQARIAENNRRWARQSEVIAKLKPLVTEQVRWEIKQAKRAC